MRTRVQRGILLAAGALAVPLVLAHQSCGSGPPASVCGNSVVESGEQCDQGAMNGKAGVPCSSDCRSISVPRVQLNLSWHLLGNLDPPVPGYKGADCPDFGATQVHLILAGPTDNDSFDLMFPCADHNKIYPDPKLCPTLDAMGQCPPATPGSYEATATLLRSDGSAITTAVSTGKVTATAGLGQPTVLLVDFEPPDFLVTGQLKGSYKFHVSWGDKNGSTYVTCAKAGVKSEALRLLDEQGKPVAGATKDGLRLDGTPGPCYSPDPILNPAQEIPGLSWGRYVLTVWSSDKSFCVSQPIFVNPGTNPPAYDIVPQAQTPPSGDGGMKLPDGGVSCP